MGWRKLMFGISSTRRANASTANNSGSTAPNLETQRLKATLVSFSYGRPEGLP